VLIQAPITNDTISQMICIHENIFVETTHIKIRMINDDVVIIPLTVSEKNEPLLKYEYEARIEKNTTTIYGTTIDIATSLISIIYSSGQNISQV
jgi:hypothetical protein